MYVNMEVQKWIKNLSLTFLSLKLSPQENQIPFFVRWPVALSPPVTPLVSSCAGSRLTRSTLFSK